MMVRLGRKTSTSHQAHGQAIVEFALIISLIMLLLAAAVDLGNAYRTYQTLVNASAEATTYLAHNPVVNCMTAVPACPGNSATAGADRIARIRFREEQGPIVRSVASTLDLDNNGKDDVKEYGWGFVEGRMRIMIADGSSQVSSGNINNPNVISQQFKGTSDANCLKRKRFDTNGNPCYAVVLARATYRPMILSFVLGREINITATSVKPIIEGE